MLIRRTHPATAEAGSVEFIQRLYCKIKAKELPPVWVNPGPNNSTRYSMWLWDGEGEPGFGSAALTGDSMLHPVSAEEIVALVEGGLTYEAWRQSKLTVRKQACREEAFYRQSRPRSA